MKFNMGVVLGLAAVFLLGFVFISNDRTPDPTTQAALADGNNGLPTTREDDDPSLLVATAYSRKCATSEGTCTLEEPQKVGSRCECPDGPGRVVR